ncbi:hypothetical protein AURDEDRAFT_178501, partial [Auricularia subglabra TFB-10046 SS5]
MPCWPARALLHQIFRDFNSVVVRRKETRRRNLTFSLPVSMPIGHQTRLLESDEASMSLQDIYNGHCARAGFSREAPSLMYAEMYGEMQRSAGRAVDKTAIFQDTVLSDYMAKTMKTPADLWRMRKEFTAQLAAASLVTYVVPLPMRPPHCVRVGRMTGRVSMTDMIPAFIQGEPVLSGRAAHVPWCFTPNIQHFVGRAGAEGVFVTGIVALARALAEPDA